MTNFNFTSITQLSFVSRRPAPRSSASRATSSTRSTNRSPSQRSNYFEKNLLRSFSCEQETHRVTKSTIRLFIRTGMLFD
jgi:hypothetical protein